MEVKVREITVRENVYIAEDGCEFYDKSACLEYERKCGQDAAESAVAGLPHFSLDFLNYSDSDLEETWYKVSTDAELKAVKTALYCEDCMANDFDVSSFPTWVRAVTDGEGYGWMQTKEEYVRSIREHLADLDVRTKEETDE